MTFHIPITLLFNRDGYRISAEEKLPFKTNRATLESLYEELKINYPRFFKMDFLCKSVFLAAEYMVQKMGNLNPHCAVVLSTSHGSLDSDHLFHTSLKSIPSPSHFVYTLPNIMIGELSIRHTLRGESALFVTPHFNPELLLNYAQTLGGQVLCGWANVVEDCPEVFLFLLQTAAVDSNKRSTFIDANVNYLKQMYNGNYQ